MMSDDLVAPLSIYVSCDLCVRKHRSSLVGVSVSDLKRGSRNGCELCTLFCNCITTLKDNATSPEDFVFFTSASRLYFARINSESILNFTLRATPFGKDTNEDTFQFSNPQMTRDFVVWVDFPKSVEHVPQDVPTNLGLDHVMELARSWMGNCEMRHLLCATSNPPKLPRRVLILPPIEGESVRLIETFGVAASYVALSYCWGSPGKHLRTTSQSLHQHLAGISWDQFPRMFQDIIQLCRALGTNYLWIDSLCIIQDDPKDWESESAKMASVYANAQLTIAAAANANPHDSLFAGRWTTINRFSNADEHHVPTGSYTFQQDGKTLRVRPVLRLAHSRFFNVNNHLIGRSDFDAPLMTRAWAFQERLLAPRTLHFHAEELVWECREIVRCECGEFGRPAHERSASTNHEYPNTTITSMSYKLKERFTAACLDGITQQAAISLWLDLVENYTKLHLTNESDRLPALSGLASEFKGASLGNYFAGMWVGILPVGLNWQRVWHSDDDLQLKKEQKQPGAPSWSWASVYLGGSNCIQISTYAKRLGSYSPEFQILSCTGETIGTNPFGWMKNVELSIRARCVECFMTWNDSPGDRGWALRILHLSPHPSSVLETLNISLDHPNSVEAGKELVFLELGWGHGLVLQKVSQDSNYQRLGTAESRFLSEDNQSDWEKIWGKHLSVKRLVLI
ncbi:HET-domain-containing protein [Corynespora cassiicola Philippines]|uniref:HET-domain-containing protein n=1 Tax=Corynespora cassiicola Philippines TaxID=1448308 RepID=A0A2T2P1G0_CORCC|nr:HET-domain-containing protein [Corynespora cassiicola Philippines]